MIAFFDCCSKLGNLIHSEKTLWHQKALWSQVINHFPISIPVPSQLRRSGGTSTQLCDVWGTTSGFPQNRSGGPQGISQVQVVDGIQVFEQLCLQACLLPQNQGIWITLHIAPRIHVAQGAVRLVRLSDSCFKVGPGCTSNLCLLPKIDHHPVDCGISDRASFWLLRLDNSSLRVHRRRPLARRLGSSIGH